MPAVLPLKKEMGFSPCGKKPHSAEKGLYSSGLFFNKLRWSFWRGHEFIRAAKCFKFDWALATEERIEAEKEARYRHTSPSQIGIGGGPLQGFPQPVLLQQLASTGPLHRPCEVVFPFTVFRLLLDLVTGMPTPRFRRILYSLIGEQNQAKYSFFIRHIYQ